MKGKIIVALILLVLISPNLVYGASSEYEFSGFTSFFGSSDALIPFNYTGSCEVQFSTFASYNITSAFTSSASWKSPFNTILTNSPTLNVLNDVTCLNYGKTAFQSIGKSNLDYYETFIDVSQSATTGFINTENKFRCQSSNEWTNFTIDDTETDEGDCFYRIAEGGGDLYTTFKNTLISNYNSCDNLNSWIDQVCLVTTSLTGNDHTVQYIYPFNSSSGSAIYDIHDASITVSCTGGGLCSADYNVDLMNIETASITNLLSETKTGTSGAKISLTDVSGTFALDKDTSYLLIYTFVKNFPVGFTSRIDDIEAPQTDLNIFTYKGDFICTGFGECQNGTKQQICSDTRGIAPDEIRQRFCLDQPLFEVTVGFEEFYDQDVYICQKDWFLLSCSDRLESFTAKYPLRWVSTIKRIDANGIERANTIEITQDYSTIGTSSLRMMFIPQKPDEPIDNGAGGTICGNKTIGSDPELSTDYNETVFIEFNLTFNSPFPAVRFDTKLCNSVPVQYDYTGDTFGIFGNPCGKRCYGDCNSTVFGDYGIKITDPNAGISTALEKININYFNGGGANETTEILQIDAVTSASSLTTASSSNFTITDGTTISNGTLLNIYARSGVSNRYVCFVSGTDDIGNILLSNSFESFNLTLSNFSAPSSTLNFFACNTSLTFTADLVEIFDDRNTTFSTTVLDWFGNASSQTESKLIDFSNLDLITGRNYTVSLAINPANPFDSRTHCVYFDNMRFTFETEALAVCESRCEGFDRLSAQEDNNGICTFTLIKNSPICADTVQLAEDMQNLIDTGEPFCNGTTLFFIDSVTGIIDTDENNQVCIDLIQQELEQKQAEINATTPLGQPGDLAIFAFLFSPIILYIIASVVLSVAATILTKHYEMGVMVLATFIFVGALPNVNLIPGWLVIAIVAVTIVLIASKISGKSFNVGGG